ncbi:hypothetical protein [Clostridium sp. 1001271B_151109_B4]|uniref:hypothetical protein n=1 Tax=Clostridium sp. 1001271B_151109_B4 TaxID=2787148 RepID=UPI0018A9DFCC|nr:hypothetical protein [Clostridium sp. 1001271B_151109_B4]
MNNKVKKSIISISTVGLILGMITTNAFAAGSRRNPQQTYGTATTWSTYAGEMISTVCEYTQWDINSKAYKKSSSVSTSGPRENTASVGNIINGARKTEVTGIHNVYGSERYSKTATSVWKR